MKQTSKTILGTIGSTLGIMVIVIGGVTYIGAIKTDVAVNSKSITSLENQNNHFQGKVEEMTKDVSYIKGVVEEMGKKQGINVDKIRMNLSTSTVKI